MLHKHAALKGPAGEFSDVDRHKDGASKRIMNAASAKAIYLLLQHLRGIEDL